MSTKIIRNNLIYLSFIIIKINEINNEYIYILNFVKALYYFPRNRIK